MYEIHITCAMADNPRAEEVAVALHWKTSEITGDPVLGKDAYFYLTNHAKSYVVAEELTGLAIGCLAVRDVQPVRTKIELTIRDTKFPESSAVPPLLLVQEFFEFLENMRFDRPSDDRKAEELSQKAQALLGIE